MLWQSQLVKQLREERDWLRTENTFLKGKVERLEIALMPSTKPEPVVVRSIEATPIETKPAKKSWRETVATWTSLTPEQQDKAMEGKPI
jgi:hypothetical protein